MLMRRLQDMVGELILAKVPFIHSENWQTFKLHGVELGGLWVESQELTNWFLDQMKIPTTPRTIIIFLPYAQIQAVFGSVDSMALSEKAFDL